MADINLINEGEPVTYELLNKIINKVNKFSDTDNDSSNAQVIKVSGIPSTEDNMVKVAVGSRKVNVLKAEEKEVTIDFPENFKTNPFVVANIIDVLPKQQGISFGAVTITEITKQNFTAKIKLFTEEKKNASININYIALGTG